MVKSLLSRLRLPGAKATKHDFKPAVIADSLADKQSDQELGGRGWAPQSPFELGQGLPPAADRAPAGPAPPAAPAPRAPSLSVFSTPQPHDAAEARAAPAGTPGAVATPTTSVPLRHEQPSPSVPPQKQQQQRRLPTQLQLPHGPAGGAPLAAQPSMDAPLPQQHSWGSPRSSDMQVGSVSSSDTVAALLPEAHCQHSGGGGGAATGVGHGRSSGGGRPAGVPPLNLASLGITPAPPAAAAATAAGQQHTGAAAGPDSGAVGAFDSHVSLSGGVAELEQELASWAAPPSWHPSSQGRWYVYPPIGHKDVAPVEALVSTLSPAQAAEVAVLWRQYAAARYSAELMAGRAVRMCRELTRELANSRAHTGHVAEQGAEHAEKLGQTIKSLQHQLDEARHAAAVAAASGAMYGNSSSCGRTCSSCRQPLQVQQPQVQTQAQHSRAASAGPAAAAPPVNEYLASPTRHHSSLPPARAGDSSSTPEGASSAPVPAPARPQLEVSACKVAAARKPSSRAARVSTVSAAAAALGLLETDDDGHSYSSCSSSPRPEALAAIAAATRLHVPQQQQQQQQLAAGHSAEALRALACENEQLLSQLEHMRGLFLEAHADGRALREALEDVDAECAALRQHGSGLSRQAAAVLQENAGLRSELAALRAALVASQRQQQQQQQAVAPLHGSHAAAHLPRPPASLAAAACSSRTPLTAPRPPISSVGSAGAGAAWTAAGGTWTPPPGTAGLALPVPAAAAAVSGAGAGAAPYGGHRNIVRTASTGPRPSAPQHEESQLLLHRPAHYADARAVGESGSSGGGGASAGAGHVARALAQALEMEGVVAVVQALPTFGSGASNAQGRALSRSGSAPASAPAAVPPQQQQQQQQHLYVRVPGQLQQQAAQRQQLMDEMAW
ncbi:hypothetical protein HYH02_001568 [Chlamydomonas schloesseri]|uniref:Uncharacterized protein n=1 Tax=Chlamydomonas schloesseri TaxID=2026947 RepID=A0A835WSF3_9CHLO|nr:hypothetical protein HYH02_001568 [Chlamydomonas schloesseri]|eukprot:KAG2453344.1 hypothetical protein HYH02_001568 [Chlamydomonas schloesseri]